MTDETILFLCAYGGAKSVIAASYFNRLAGELELPYVAVALSAEEPYPAVPEAVADFLLRDGIDVRSFQPRRVDVGELREAFQVVSIDCNLDGLDLAGTKVERWDDVPKPSEDLPASATAIRCRVEALIGGIGTNTSYRPLAEELLGRR
ncbi:MAG: hypothetical protein HYU52_09230 [Acidobacteria bacterium]|nr:hypothetical protein [Acidobacteriota bacterium]